MNPYTGHLVGFADEVADAEMERLRGDGYLPVPEELKRAAETKLRGRREAHVSLTSGGKLARWAKEKRRARRRNQIARVSRRRNRK